MTDRLLPGSLRSAADLLQKVRRDAALLDEEVTSDRFFNFVVTAYSLIDWIDHDPTVPITAKAPAEIAALRADPWLLLCGDAAEEEPRIGPQRGDLSGCFRRDGNCRIVVDPIDQGVGSNHEVKEAIGRYFLVQQCCVAAHLLKEVGRRAE